MLQGHCGTEELGNVVSRSTPWNLGVWESLIRWKASGRFPHALLLVGPSGIGKSLLAQHFAQTMLCEKLLEGDFACGSCSACRRFQVGSHPDFLWIRPSSTTESRTSENETSEETTPKSESRFIRIEQIRTLLDWIALTPHYDGYKLALLSPADCLNRQSANGLLKTLEEPAGNSILMLATANPTQLPATVRSRCQEIRFSPASPEQALSWLAQKGIEDHTSAKQALILAKGAPLAALELIQNGTLEKRKTLFTGLESVVLGRTSPVAVANEWNGHTMEMVISLYYSWIEDMIHLASATGALLMNPDLASRLQSMANILGIQRLFTLLDDLNEVTRLIQGSTNPNQLLLLENLLISLKI
ncbi:DNA polymerase III subunit delta' [Gammaproteobacteria bacterium]